MRTLVEFARADLDARTRPAWRERIQGLLGAGLNVQANQAELSDDTLRAMQEAAATVLDDLVLARDRDPGADDSGAWTLRPLSDYQTRVGFLVLDNERLYVQYDGAPLDVFRLVMVRLIEQSGLERLRRCARPDCGHIFWRVKGQRFCSARCQHRQFMRDERMGLHDKEGGQ